MTPPTLTLPHETGEGILGRDLRPRLCVTIFGNGEQGRGPDGRAVRFGGLGGKSGLHGQGAG